MAHTAYLETREKIVLGEVKFTVIHLTPKLTKEEMADRKKEVGNELFSIFEKYADAF